MVLLKSPAAPAAFLLYGILFGFAGISYLILPWQRSYTIAFYLAVSLWSAVVALGRRGQFRSPLNRVDLLFWAFLLLVLFSAATHWWVGTAKYLEFTPFFFVLPFLLGRMMSDEDILLFWKVLLAMGTTLLVLIPLEYLKRQLPYVNWPSEYLFSQNHSVMLSGLIFAAMLLVVVSRLLLLPASKPGATATNCGRQGLYLFAAFGLVIIAFVWVAARGSALAAMLCMGVLFAFSPYCGLKRKIAISLVFAVFVLIAFHNPFQNKFSRQYYQAVVQPPPVMLNLGNAAADTERYSLQYGKPILGENACSVVVDSVSDRWVHYQTALAIFLSKPLTGVGANAYGFYSCHGPGWFPHSTILQVMAELGLVGAAVYGLLMFAAIRAVLKRYHASGEPLTKSIAAWLLAYLALQLTTSQLYGNYFLSAGLYFVVGVAARVASDSDRVPGRA